MNTRAEGKSWVALVIGAAMAVTACGGGGGGGGMSTGGSVTAPSGLSYLQSFSVYTVNTAIGRNIPTYSGGQPTSFTVSPPLPAGLSIDPSIGVISGTPTAVTAEGTYTIKAMNSAGSTTAVLEIAVANNTGTWLQNVSTAYKSAAGGLAGTFSTFQDADILLSGIDFDNTGGAGLYNHLGTISCDNTHLVVADRNNNRVLVWNTLPSSNAPPDFVLGQPDFVSNNPGTGLNQLNWPVSVSAAGNRLVVSDAFNNRILLWDHFPTSTQQPADRSISQLWPWGVWTDGAKVAATETESAPPSGDDVNLWNAWPTRTDQAPDIVIHGAPIGMGTPRTITSNGNYLVVADHNASIGPYPDTNFFWTSWPTQPDQPPAFYRTDPQLPGGWMQGAITADSHLVMFGSQALSIWNALPMAATQAPDLIVGAGGFGRPGFDFTGGGDGSGACAAGGKLYVSISNGNRVVGFNGLPVSPTQMPDFVLGAPDISTNTLLTHGFITNPNPKSDGTALFALSDFDSALYVWKTRPDNSGALPDYIFHTAIPELDLSVAAGKLFVAGRTTVLGWTSGLPSTGAYPDFYLSGGVGAVQFQDLQGVSWDGTWFALSDSGADKIYVWNGIPNPPRNPDHTIATGPAGTSAVGRLSSNGTTLAAVLTQDQKIALYDLTNFNASPQYVDGSSVGNPDAPIRFNLPNGVALSGTKLFVADTSFNRVQIWNDFSTATSGSAADVILGQPANSINDTSPAIGKNTLFWPGAVFFDGSYLWVGEFKFSGRLLRFSIH